MRKFTKIKNRKEVSNSKKDNVLYDDNHIQILKYEDWSIIKENDIVICIVYLIETNQIILRHEYIPTYKYRDNQEYFLTLIGGGVEKDENTSDAIIREIEEEAGIVINADYKLEPLKPLFISKGNTNKYHPFIIPLAEKDYYEVVAKGDGSKIEKISKSVKVDAKFINSINASDLITDYMIMKIKEYLNI